LDFDLPQPIFRRLFRTMELALLTVAIIVIFFIVIFVVVAVFPILVIAIAILLAAFIAIAIFTALSRTRLTTSLIAYLAIVSRFLLRDRYQLQ
jgi:hypothetical protein